MYFFLITMLLFVLPISSIIVEMMLNQSFNFIFLMSKWFVFYAGFRLFLAGLRQIFQPSFTANILGITESASLHIVQELGFANVSIGLLCSLSLFIPVWIIPSLLVSGLFYGLAGFGHLITKKRNCMATFAMITDFWAFFILISCFIINVSQR